MERIMTVPTPSTPQVPLATQIAALGPQSVQPEPVPVPPTNPYAVLLTDSNQVERPIVVTKATLKLVRNGTDTARGSIELEAQVHGRTDIPSLLTIANMTGPYSVTLRYFAFDGSVVRNDVIAVNATSRAEYTGPQLEQGNESWVFVERLIIHA